MEAFSGALPLDTRVKTLLQNVKLISASTASRFFSHDTLYQPACWEYLNEWQFEQFNQAYRHQRGRRPHVILKIDLTCIEKTGKHIPYARRYNRQYGIHLLALHACIGNLSFPVAQRIYQGKESVTALALALLAQFPASCWPGRVVVLADAGFGNREFLLGSRELGFDRVIVGIRHDRVLIDGRQLHDLKRKGEQVALHDLPKLPLFASWCTVNRGDTKKRFHVVATFAAVGQYLCVRYRRRFMIEAFFKSAKYDFGLKEARLRTKAGIGLWIFCSFLVFSLASLERFSEQSHHEREGTLLTMQRAARQVLETLLAHHLLVSILAECEGLSCGRYLKVPC